MAQVDAPSGVELEVYHALKRAFLLLDDCDRHLFTEYGLSTRQYWALQALDEERGRPMSELGRLLFTDKSNVTSIVDRLEAAGLARRSPASHDRRVILLYLTPQGRQLANHMRELHDARVRDLIGVIPEHDLLDLPEKLGLIGAQLQAFLAHTGNGAIGGRDGRAEA